MNRQGTRKVETGRRTSGPRIVKRTTYSLSTQAGVFFPPVHPRAQNNTRPVSLCECFPSWSRPVPLCEVLVVLFGNLAEDCAPEDCHVRTA